MGHTLTLSLSGLWNKGTDDLDFHYLWVADHLSAFQYLGPSHEPCGPTASFSIFAPKLQAPENSHIVPCGSVCPATCANHSDSEHCSSHLCDPTCQCLLGHLLAAGGLCILCPLFLLPVLRPYFLDRQVYSAQPLPNPGALMRKVPRCWPDKCCGCCQASTGGWHHCLLAQPSVTPCPGEATGLYCH